MTYNIDNSYSRRQTKTINIGSINVGGNSPISVQSMTNTITEEIDATVAQIIELQMRVLILFESPVQQKNQHLH